AVALRSAIRTFILPRGASDPLTTIVFKFIRRLFNLRLRGLSTYSERDSVMALYAPISLLALPPAWLACVCAGYTLIYRAIGASTWREAFFVSGSSLLTLGNMPLTSVAESIISFSEATLGLILVTILISYLPTMYSAFSRREAAVNLLDVRAGSPPSAVEMLARYHRIHGFAELGEVWRTWETWFADIEETHTSLAALAFFRSPQPDRSWITAAGAVLDAASLVDSTVDLPRDPLSNLCLRAGYLALRRIADFFLIPYNPNPTADDGISVSREEYDAACAQLIAQGITLKPDRDKAWRDFVGWRVNYDTVLLALAALTMAPYAPWSSDRSLRMQRHM
ncbi:MAG TPA: hypothetical protein VGK81_05475, partial [Anaerolineae bacterium]